MTTIANALNINFLPNQLIYASGTNQLTGLLSGNNGVLITSGSGVPSVSSTLPLAVQNNITNLGTIASIGAPLGGAFGGTGINNGTSTFTIGGNTAFSGAFTFVGTLTGNTTLTFPISGTLATTSGASGIVNPGLINEVAYYAAAGSTVSGLATAANGVLVTSAGSVPSISSTLPNGLAMGTPLSLTLTNATGLPLTTGVTGLLPLANGGLNANLTANIGGIFYSTASAGAILAGTATALQMLQSGSSAAPSWSTSTWPATTTINQILYSSSANVVAGLTTANNGVLITSGAGIPSISSTLPTAVQGNITSVGALASGSLAAGFTPVTVPIGGTGLSTATPYAVLCGGTTATGNFQSIASVGTAGTVLTSNGAGALPTFQSGPASLAGSLKSFQILTSGTAATYTTPAGITSLLVECLGGGGGGGGCAAPTAQNSAAGGGGGGGYARKWITGAAGTYTYTVGASGGGGSAGNNPGTAGTASTFSTISAGGGGAGTGGPVSVASGLNAASVAGGTSSGGDINFAGGRGMYGWVNGTVEFIAFSGAGGNSHYSQGALNVVAGTANQTVAGNAAAANSGAGGSGAAAAATSTASAGGAGGSGIIIVWEFS